MPADVGKVQRVLDLIREDERLGWVIEGQFTGFSEHVRIGAYVRGKQDPANAAALRRAHGHLRALSDDVMSLFGVLLRTALDLERRRDGTLSDGLWFQFSRQDIEFFFLVLRSALDHVAGVIVSAAPSKQWIEESSFDTLRTRCLRPDAEAVLGPEWVRLVRSCDWFDDLRGWRVALAHHGGLTLTFFDDETIPFQIQQGAEQMVKVPEIMFNEHVVDFTRFAALYFSYVLCFLEDMTLVSKRYLDLGGRMSAMHAGGGVEALHHWATRLMAMRPGASQPPSPLL